MRIFVLKKLFIKGFFLNNVRYLVVVLKKLTTMAFFSMRGTLLRSHFVILSPRTETVVEH